LCRDTSKTLIYLSKRSKRSERSKSLNMQLTLLVESALVLPKSYLSIGQESQLFKEIVVENLNQSCVSRLGQEMMSQSALVDLNRSQSKNELWYQSRGWSQSWRIKSWHIEICLTFSEYKESQSWHKLETLCVIDTHSGEERGLSCFYFMSHYYLNIFIYKYILFKKMGYLNRIYF
jgi:hypothetical protein